MNADVLERAIEQNRVAQAYLFTAPVRAAADGAAKHFLRLLMCRTHSACGQCDGCKKLVAGNHVDVMQFNGDAKMAELREVGDFLWKTPFDGDRKAVYIEGADSLRPQAQNFLLKPMEEPASDTVFILSAPAPERLLATVRSRCQQYAAPKKARQEVAAALPPGERAQVAAALSGGYVEEAERLLADEEFWDIREKAKETAAKLVTVKNPSAYLMMERLLVHQERLMDGVLELLRLVMDAERKSLGSSAEFAPDAEEITEKMAKFYTPEGLLKTREILSEEYDRLARCRSINGKLAVQGMVFRILEVRAKWHRS